MEIDLEGKWLPYLTQKLGAIVLEIKGGDIECHGTVFHQINSKTNEVSILNPEKKNDPLSQAIDGVYHYRKVIDSIATNLSDRFPIEAAVWFPNVNISDKISSFPLKYREISGAVLGNEHFNKEKQFIYDIFNFYYNRQKLILRMQNFKNTWSHSNGLWTNYCSCR